MSTNDTVMLMASGACRSHAVVPDFAEALTRACTDLAMQLLADAEGADHEIAINVLNAATEDDALEVGRSDRAEQPLQGRGLRQRPQLGPGARLDRHHRRRRSTPPTSTSP